MSALTVSHLASTESYKHYEIWRRLKNGAVEMHRTNVLKLLENRGYYLFRQSPSKSIFIRIVKNIVKEVGKKDLIDEVMGFLQQDESAIIENIYEQFASNIGKWFTEGFFLLLQDKKVEQKRDISNAMQFYFQNCIVKVTATGVQVFDYTKLNGYIWESQIIQREFTEVELDSKFDFIVFINRLCNFEEHRVTSLCTVLGYMLHNYKNASFSPAIILNDEVISDNPEGGTGKGILAHAIEKFRKMVRIDGKLMDFQDKFLYQLVETDTQVIFFDDVKKSFDFERLFSTITEGISVELKGAKKIFIPFDESPKILISTNYAIKGTGNSHERRRVDIEISQAYNRNRTPEMEFKRMLFTGWKEEDWQQFDNFMCMCAGLYLQRGIIQQTLVNLPEKKLINETNTDFIMYMQAFDFNRVGTAKLYDSFLELYDEYRTEKWFNKKVFGKWVRIYAEAQGYTVESVVSNGARYFDFIPGENVIKPPPADNSTDLF